MAGAAEAGDAYEPAFAANRLKEIDEAIKGIDAEKLKNGQAKGISPARTTELNSSLTVRAEKLGSEAEKLRLGGIAHAQKERDLNTPIAELYPNATMAARVGAVGTGLALSAAVKGGSTIRYNKQIKESEKLADEASKSGLANHKAGNYGDAAGDLAAARVSQSQLDGRIKKGVGGDVASWAPAFGGLEAALVGPQMYDYATAKAGSKLKDDSNPGKNLDELAFRTLAAGSFGLGLSKMATAPMSLFKRSDPTGSSPAIANLESRLNGKATIDAARMAESDAAGVGSVVRRNAIGSEAAEPIKLIGRDVPDEPGFFGKMIEGIGAFPGHLTTGRAKSLARREDIEASRVKTAAESAESVVRKRMADDSALQLQRDAERLPQAQTGVAQALRELPPQTGGHKAGPGRAGTGTTGLEPAGGQPPPAVLPKNPSDAPVTADGVKFSTVQLPDQTAINIPLNLAREQTFKETK